MPIQRTNRQGKKIWQGRIALPNGQRKERTFSTKREALDWEALARQKLTELSETSTQKDYSLHSLFSLYLNACRNRGMSPRTIDDKKLCYRKLLSTVSPAINVVAVGYNRIENFLSDVAKQASGKRANRFRTYLLSAYAWGIKALSLPEPCPWRVEKYKTQQQPRRVPTLEELQRVIDVAAKDKKNLLLALLHTAARKDEIFSLTWDDVNLDDRTVRLWTSKRSGGKEFNIIPMSDTLYAILLEQRKRTAFLSYVFINEYTKSRYSELNTLMQQLCIKAGVLPFSFHAIRHLSASMLAKAGVPLPTIQAILRHQASTTTSRYLHSLEGAKVIGHKLDNVFVLHKKVEASSILAEEASPKR